MSESNPAGSKLNTWLVLATWALVGVGFVGAGLSYWGYSNLIDEQQRSTEMQWRPYLNLVQLPGEPQFAYFLGDTDTSAFNRQSIDSIKLGSSEYFAVRRIAYLIPRLANLYNSGKTPLRIITSVTSVLSQREWIGLHGKSYERLIDQLNSPGTIDTLHTDYVLLPGDSTPENAVFGIRRTMFKEEWGEYVDSGRMVVYPYLYIEYEDFFEHQYSAVQILCMQATIQVIDSVPVFTWSDQIGVERYRWDVGLND